MTLSSLCGVSGGLCEDYCGDRPGLCGLFTVTWGVDGDLAAVLLWDRAEGRGVVWMNRHLIRSSLNGLVRRWAIHRVWTGKDADVLHLGDLAALPADLAPTVA